MSPANRRPLRCARSRPGVFVLALLLALFTLFTSTATATATSRLPSVASPAATTCPNLFQGTEAQLKRFFTCHNVPFDVVSASSPALAQQQQGVVPNAGGPSCQWYDTHSWEACFQQGRGHIVCSGWIIGNSPYHCGPTSTMTLQSITKLYSIRSTDSTVSKWGQACSWGMLTSFVSGIIVTGVTGGTGAPAAVGIVLGTGLGCVGGLVTYWVNGG